MTMNRQRFITRSLAVVGSLFVPWKLWATTEEKTYMLAYAGNRDCDDTLICKAHSPEEAAAKFIDADDSTYVMWKEMQDDYMSRGETEWMSTWKEFRQDEILDMIACGNERLFGAVKTIL